MSTQLGTYHVPTGPVWTPVPPPPARRPRRWPQTLLLILVAILAGAVGGTAAQWVDGAAQPSTVTVTVAPAQRLAGAPLDVATVAATIEPAVVRIEARLPGDETSTGTGTGTGTGIVLTSDGSVLTNAHVVDGATRVVVFPGAVPRARLARVTGIDRNADIALLQIDRATGLPVAPLASSAQVRVGDDVVAIGHTLGMGGTPTVSRGIVSGLNRSLITSDADLAGLLQTDAAISSGNSGGPLVNAAGQVIGITTAVAAGDRTNTAENVNFAIPTDTAVSVLRDFGLTITAP